MITAIDLDIQESNIEFTIIVVSLELTQKGLENMNSCLEETYKYLLYMKDSAIHKVSDYIISLSKQKFALVEDISSNITELSKNLFKFDPEEVLSGSILATAAKDSISEIITRLVNMLNIDNSFIILSTPFELPQNIKDMYFKQSQEETVKNNKR